MTKPKNKKSWLDKLIEADSKQQSRLDKAQLKSPLRQGPSQKLDAPLPKIPYIVVILATIILPLLGWVAGAAANPTGWMSDDPYIFVIFLLVLCMHYWFISIPLLLIIVALIIGKQRQIASFLVISISIVATMFIFNTTITADESEFTG